MYWNFSTVETMADKLNKILIWLALFLFLALQPSCRIFQKTVESESQKTEFNSSVIDNGKVTENNSLDSDLIETREINIKFNEYSPRSDKGNIDLSLDSDFKVDIPEAALDRLVERISELSIKVETKKTELQKSSKIEEKDLKELIELEDQSKSKKTVKESDSTIGANVPWYVWIIGGVLIFGIVWYLVKQVKIV